MKKRQISLLLIALMLFLLSASPLTAAQAAAKAQVHAVLFFSPTCGHCEKVINEVLPPLQNQFGDSLAVSLIDVTTDQGQSLYQSALIRYTVPDDRLGVPTLIVGDEVLVGSLEIPQRFPGLIETHLANGGVDWPDIPGLADYLGVTSQPVSRQTWQDKFQSDPLANTIALIVLILMVVIVGIIGYRFIQGNPDTRPWPEWIIPVLSVLGLFVAGYMSYVEVTQVQAVCGPVGNCNAVQQSEYARLFGILPVGILGALGYIALLAAWLVKRYGPQNLHKASIFAIWGMAWFGILFSIYLTFLEPFVIGSSCVWCISQALIMTLVFWASSKDAFRAWGMEEEGNELPARTRPV